MYYTKLLSSLFLSTLLLACVNNQTATSVGMTQPGEKIADPDTLDYQGKAAKLSNYLGKKYTLIDFWGTWCAPCVDALPKLREAYEKIDKDKVTFVNICSDCDENAEKLIKEHKMVWAQINDKDDIVTNAFGVGAFPAIYLIDSDGKVITHSYVDKAFNDDIVKALAKYIK